MDDDKLEQRLAVLEEKLNKLLERDSAREEVELVSVEDIPERISLGIPENTVPRRIQMDLVLLGGSRPRREITLDLVLMGGSRPRSILDDEK
jgi:nucleotide-binding universal stress UspA family protein